MCPRRSAFWLWGRLWGMEVWSPRWWYLWCFVDSIDKANQLVLAGVTVNGLFTPVFPLSNLVKKVIVSNIPPLLKNDMLLRKLSWHGHVVSLVRLNPLGSKSPLLRHVVSSRQQVSMVLKEELKLTLCFTVDVFDYSFCHYYLKCFCCGEDGHVIWSCPNGTEASRPAFQISLR